MAFSQFKEEASKLINGEIYLYHVKSLNVYLAEEEDIVDLLKFEVRSLEAFTQMKQAFISADRLANIEGHSKPNYSYTFHPDKLHIVLEGDIKRVIDLCETWQFISPTTADNSRAFILKNSKTTYDSLTPNVLLKENLESELLEIEQTKILLKKN